MTEKPVDSNQTKMNLLQIATQEFGTTGFQNTSLRDICRKAGCTTGAIYFFFKNKDDLFTQIVESVTMPMYAFMKEHFIRELSLNIGELLNVQNPFTLEKLFNPQESQGQQLEKGEKSNSIPESWENEDKNELIDFLHFYYCHKNTFKVLLNNRNHPVVEGFFNDVVELFEEHYMAIIKKVAQISYRTTPIDEYAVHWFSKTDLEMILNLISHDFSEEEAIKHGGTLLKVMQAGFMTLL